MITFKKMREGWWGAVCPLDEYPEPPEPGTFIQVTRKDGREVPARVIHLIETAPFGHVMTIETADKKPRKSRGKE